MKQLQLKDLYAACKKYMEAGNGNKYLIAANDNEGNGYHGMFYALTVINSENVEGVKGWVGDNTEPNLNNVIIVG